MKTKLLTTFEKWANWKGILALFALQMLFNLVIMPSVSSSDTHNLPILDLQFWYTPQRAYEIIAANPAELRQATAIGRLTVDMVYPLVYGFMLSFMLVVTFRRAFPTTNLKLDNSARSAHSRQSSLNNHEIATSQKDAPRNFISDLVVFIPWAGVLADYLENFSLSAMYLSYPTELIPLAWMASVFTATKWTLIRIAFALVLIGAVKLAVNRLKTSDVRH